MYVKVEFVFTDGEVRKLRSTRIGTMRWIRFLVETVCSFIFLSFQHTATYAVSGISFQIFGFCLSLFTGVIRVSVNDVSNKCE